MGITQKFSMLLSISLAACAVDTGDGTGGALETLGESDAALCANALSAAEEKLALKLIDDICGDTWCEGDHNFAFDRLSCRSTGSPAPGAGTCTLRLRFISYDEPPRSFPRTCTTQGFDGFSSLVDVSAGGYQSLNWDYYLALSDCINQLEAELPR